MAKIAIDMRTQAEVAALQGSANSMTHKNEYNQFIRACCNRKKFPSALAGPFKESKGETFNVWLQNKKDLQRTAMVFTRRATHKERLRHRWAFRKKRDIDAMYPEKMQLVKDIIKSKEQNGLWEADPEAKDDPEERMYWMRIDKEFISDDIAEEVTEIQLEADIKNVDDVLGEDSIFSGGAGVNVPGLAAGGNEAFQSVLAQQVGIAPAKKVPKEKKKPAKKGDEKGAEAVDGSARSFAEKVRDQCLVEHTEAQRMVLQLDNKKQAGPVKDELAKHSKSMKDNYQQLEKLLAEDGPDDNFEALTSKIVPLFCQYTENKAIAEAIIKAVKPKKKAKPAVTTE